MNTKNIYEEFGITQQHLNNLRTLRDWFIANPGREKYLNMRSFAHINSEDDDIYLLPNEVVLFEKFAPEKLKCGAAYCLVGHGPLAGLPAGEAKNWHDYCHATFGFSRMETSKFTSLLWFYLFSSDLNRFPLSVLLDRITTVLEAESLPFLINEFRAKLGLNFIRYFSQL